jgi:hypothetical protein
VDRDQVGVGGLQEYVDAFDADIRDVLLSVDPSESFSQDVTFGAKIARR